MWWWLGGFPTFCEQFPSFTGRPGERVIAVWERAGVKEFAVRQHSRFYTNRHECKFRTRQSSSTFRNAIEHLALNDAARQPKAENLCSTIWTAVDLTVVNDCQL